jgi:predicted Zn-dependent protease
VDGEHTIRNLHRDVLLISVLVLAIAGLYAITKTVAARERELDKHLAALWFKRGEQHLAAHDVETAIDSFRNATSGDPDSRRYGLALAASLAQANHRTEAEQALMRLRNSSPDDSGVNLQLARLSAQSNDVRSALRYYHDAIYGVIGGQHTDEQRRNMRTELIHFLLKEQDRNDALSELIVIDADLPDTAEAHIGTAELFMQTGDARRALRDYKEAIHLDHHNPVALTGAAAASMQLGEYKYAREYLENPSSGARKSPELSKLLAVLRIVTSTDPLALHLSTEARVQRLRSDLEQAAQRFDACSAKHAITADDQSLKGDYDSILSRLNSNDPSDDQGVIPDGLELIGRMEARATALCGPPQDNRDEAMVLLTRNRGELQ